MITYIRWYFFRKIFFAFKSFQTKNQYLWSLIDFHLFLLKNKLFAFRTIPSIILSKNFLSLELFQAIINGGWSSSWCWAFGAWRRCKVSIVFFFYLIKDLLNLFFILSPIQLYIIFLISLVLCVLAIFDVFRKKIIIKWQFASTTIFLSTIRAAIISWRRNHNYPENIIFFILLYIFFFKSCLINRLFIEYSCIWVNNFIIYLLICKFFVDKE